MTKSFFGRRPAGRLAVVLLMASTGCNRGTTFFHDAGFVPNGVYMEAASLMPGCACVTLRNTTELSGQRRDIFLEAELFGTPRGRLRLDAGHEARVRFDWAGPDDTDRYQIFANEIGPDGNPGPRLEHAWDGFAKVGKVVETTCEDSLCQFGSLGMDRAHSSATGENDVRHEPGVHLVNGGQQIELASVRPMCGCVVVENFTPLPIRLKAGFHGVDEGVMTLPGGSGLDRFAFIGFDWAGALDEDVYTMSALGLEAAPGAGGTAGMTAHSPTKPLKIADHLRVVEEMNFLPCTEEGAEMLAPHRMADTGETMGASTTPAICPYGPFRLNRARSLLTGPTPTPAGAAPPAGRGRGRTTLKH